MVRTKEEFWGAYAAEASAVARERLRLGGARLALILNSLHEQAAATAQAQPLLPAAGAATA